MRFPTALLATLCSLLASTGCAGECEDEACHLEEEAALFEQAYEEGQQPGKADGTDCSGVRVPDRNGFNKRVALTFDDGPNPDTTPEVMAILKRHGAPATFFINSARLSKPGAPAVAAAIAADPDFILANHSHGHLNLAEQTPTRVAQEIERTDTAIRTAGAIPRYFRFPFGSSTCSTMAEVRSRGYIATGWHVDSADWCFAAGNGVCKASTFRYVPDDMRTDMGAYVMSQTRASNGGVILFHDIHASTAAALDGILTRLTAEGYTFVRLDDTEAFPRLHGIFPAPAKFIGTRCEADIDCAFTASGKVGRCHDAGFCTIACEGGCPDLAGAAPTFCIADDASDTGGTCVSKAATQNGQCLGLPGTERRAEDRFLGSSTASASTATVCAPR